MQYANYLVPGIKHGFLIYKTHVFWTIVCIGSIIGFLSGLLGKGGSAITTPALQVFAGISPLAALASPLPATLPTTLSASYAYRNKNMVNYKVVTRSFLVGVPATLAGSYFTRWFNGHILMLLTAVFVFGMGASFFVLSTPVNVKLNARVAAWRIDLVALGVGLLSGLLANSGGVLFAPLFIRFLKMPTKQAMATSLIVATGLAIPGTLAHWYLGHIDWVIVLILSLSSIPFAYLGARVALKIKTSLLENIFGAMLVAFGLFDFVYTLMA